MHSFLSERAGRAGLTDPPITGPMFWLRWCCWPFACTHIANTDLCPHELRGPSVKENRGDLRTSRLWAWWPHILNGRCSDIDWLSCAASLPGSQVYLKLPMPMDIMCVVVKQILLFYHAKTSKWRFLGQKKKKNSETISEHQRFKNFPWRAYLQTPLA